MPDPSAIATPLSPSSDLGAVVAGSVILTAALLALAVYLARPQSSPRATLSFAALCGLYGLRLLLGTATFRALLGATPSRSLVDAITYVINVPAVLFTEELLGPGWHGSIRWVRRAFVLFAAVAFGGWLLGREPDWTMPANSALVIVGGLIQSAHIFRRRLLPPEELVVIRTALIVFAALALGENLRGLGLLPWPEGAEAVGFICLLAGLAYVVARRVFANERRLVAIDQELVTARRIQASILPRSLPRVPGLRLAVRHVPATSVAGDFYQFLGAKANGLGILVADVSGHGVPAALIASMVKVAAVAEAAHAADPARILRGLNRLFCDELDGQFVTATCLHLDLARRRLAYASAGHPPSLVWRARTRAVERLTRNGALLGVFPDAEYETAEEPIDSGDRVLLYTDGLLDVATPAGDFFEEQRFRELIAEHAGLGPDDLADAVLRRLAQWSERREGGFDDDLTLVIADVV